MHSSAALVVDRLCDAVRRHDVDLVVDCFLPDYRNETPAHPGRGFIGSAQVRTNWGRLFAGVPDITADVVRTCVDGDGDGDVVWSEWEMRGTRTDGGAHLMRGVIIFGVRGPQAQWARFYLEPVDDAADGVDAAIGKLVPGGAPR